MKPKDTNLFNFMIKSNLNCNSTAVMFAIFSGTSYKEAMFLKCKEKWNICEIAHGQKVDCT